MSLIMAGIDYKTADVAVRELFSHTSAAAKDTMRLVRKHPAVEGCVLLSTCNRTELYLSCIPDGEASAQALLCSALGLSPDAFGRYFVARRDRQAISHLMMVTAGLRSQIRGEDQILAQVKTAIALAREENCADPVLETLFRCAVSAAKKAKTLAPITPVESSVALRALETLWDARGDLSGMRALVIGNGEMGRLIASLLVGAGCRVTVTLRSYKRGEIRVPERCATIPYDQRYELMPKCDILVSATTSPHYTVTADTLAGLSPLPAYLVDLAVPRDIEPSIADRCNVRLWNVDTLGRDTARQESAQKLMQVKEIIGEYIERYYKWRGYREHLRECSR